MDLTLVDNSWTLFLDRDGVINVEKPGTYITNWNEFIFYDGVKEAIRIFASRFKYIFVITNQRGVSRGITKPENLLAVHQNMTDEIFAAGGRIDRVYFCIDEEATSPHRKPNPGMGWQAKRDFGLIDFKKSVMVGNKLSDMEFGRNLGCTTIYLTTTDPGISEADICIDAVYASLIDFAKAL